MSIIHKASAVHPSEEKQLQAAANELAGRGLPAPKSTFIQINTAAQFVPHSTHGSNQVIECNTTKTSVNV